MKTNEQINSEIVKATLAVHEQCEELLSIVRKAAEDRRFKMTLADHRAYRDLVDDCELILNESWRESFKIPVDITYKNQNVITAQAHAIK